MKISRKEIKLNKRGKRKSKKCLSKKLRLLGVNSGGLRLKLMTFKKVLCDLKPSIFFIEETKYKDVGKIKLENYMIFELVRQSRDGGGGLAIGCVKDLHPVWMREGDDLVEALSISISIKNMSIRCCVAYGCQENDLTERKEAFWRYLDEDVLMASNSGSGFILQFDGNLWAGCAIIPGDPRPQNRNGKLFEAFLDRNPHLSVVNALPQCEGLITRSRFRDGKWEKSVLDFFVICNRVLPFLTKMVIDERKQHILTNYQNLKNGGKVVDTDHRTQYIDLDLEIVSCKPERREIYNFKETEGLKRFKEITSNTNKFSACFENMLPLQEQIKLWQDTLKSDCKIAFKKIRIKKNNVIPVKKEISELINKRNTLINHTVNSPQVKDEIDQINNDIASMEAEQNRNKIIKNFSKFSEDPENIHMSEMWKMLKKVFPKSNHSLPAAKKNHRGKVIHGAKELKILLAKEYKERLRTRPIRPDMISLKLRRKKIFQIKMKLAERNRSKPWNVSNLDLALSQLKNNKSRDNDGYVNEI